MSTPDHTSDLRFWRTLDELADDAGFEERLRQEFPAHADTLADPVERRTFLKCMGASLALAGVTACTRQPVETIVPYVRQPEDLVPGKPLFYATALPIGGAATGLLVETHEGRPTKVEGNPLHPGSLGATSAVAQAAVLGLYDPDRARTLTNLGEIRPWSAFLGTIRAALTRQRPSKGAGFRLLTESVTSPTMAHQIRELLAEYPSAKWHQWDPVSTDNARAGSLQAFGAYVDVRYRVDRADVILALDADLLGSGPASLRYAREYAARKRPRNGAPVNRLYAVESMPTSTGARADHRVPLRPSAIASFARQVAAALGATPAARDNQQPRGLVEPLARDLQAHRGASIVVAGDGQPPSVHALAHAMNQALGNVGQTVFYTDPVEAAPVNQLQSLRDLAADMDAGTVDLLVIFGGNPVFTAPVDIRFSTVMAKVPLRVHLSLYDDETSALCQWQIPEAHVFESWSDTRAYDGTASIIQPLIAPLYDGKSPHELLAAMSDRPERSSYDIVREYWSRTEPSSGPLLDDEFEGQWRRWLHDGVVAGTAFEPRTVSVRPLAVDEIVGGTEPSTTDLEVAFCNDPTVLDGRFANNGWLQELPKPITRLTWDNALLVSPVTAARLGATATPAIEGGEHGQIDCSVAELRYHNRVVRGPLFPVAGHPDGCVTLHLGYGRTRAGRLGSGAGFNANAIRTSTAPWFDGGASLTLTGDRYSLACTQYHHLMEGRDIVRVWTMGDQGARAEAGEAHTDAHDQHLLTLYPAYPYTGHKWGMTIDINACIGCNACVVACQAENNIPVVGKDQVLRGREMHWIRIDTYHRGPAGNPETYFQPVPCMQCENAPCEVVCPVGATVHSSEGLNDMVYNRCVGTRYCANNCPYKVRRFNFLLYQDWDTPSLKLGRNPSVTVRSRGVMEKCTYCVQRINAAKQNAEVDDRPLRDGQIQTACQQSCPAEAIVFGDLNDPQSRVSAMQRDARNYALLAGLNTRPRTTYLAAVRNANPEAGT